MEQQLLRITHKVEQKLNCFTHKMEQPLTLLMTTFKESRFLKNKSRFKCSIVYDGEFESVNDLQTHKNDDNSCKRNIKCDACDIFSKK